jgi:hypothetical protein
MIIENIISSRGEDFSWVSTTPSYYDDDEDYIEDEPIEELPSSPTIATLINIRNLCDTIQNNIVNSETTDDSFLMMGLMEVENKLKEFNDTLNSLMDYNNNQAMEGEPQILTGDIILQ